MHVSKLPLLGKPCPQTGGYGEHPVVGQDGPVPIIRGTERLCGLGHLIYIPPLSSTLASEQEVRWACGNSSATVWKAKPTEKLLPMEGEKELVV